jgi:hypothetical protein
MDIFFFLFLSFDYIQAAALLSQRPKPRRLRSHTYCRAHSSGAHARREQPERSATETTEPKSKPAALPAAATGGWGWEAGAWWETGGRSASYGSAPWAAP